MTEEQFNSIKFIPTDNDAFVAEGYPELRMKVKLPDGGIRGRVQIRYFLREKQYYTQAQIIKAINKDEKFRGI